MENININLGRDNIKVNDDKLYLFTKRMLDILGSLTGILLLSPIFLTFYAQLVLTALSADLEITKEMVHDSWSVATYYKNNIKFHQSIKPFVCLSKEVQELDQPYVEKLNEVLNYFRDLKQIIKISNSN